jgi:PAS domain S-box-containing protein
LYATLETSPITDDNGNYVGALASVMDTTERRKAEQMLKESEEKYRSLVELAPDGIVAVNTEGIITSVNRSFLTLVGYDSEEGIVGKPFTELKSSRVEDIPKTQEMFMSLMKGKSPSPVEFLYVRKDGTSRWAEVHPSLLVKDGNPVGAQVIMRDVTERKKAEEALKDAKQKWTSLTENTDEIVLIVDSEGIIQYINRTIPPYTPEETIGKTVYEYVPREQHDTMRSSLKKTFETGVPLDYVVSSSIPKTGTIWFKTKIVPVKDDEKTVSVILMTADITELKNTGERLKETNMKLAATNEKLQVVGSLTRHDVRNKLTAVTGNAYLARKKLPGNSEVLDYMKQIETSVEQTVKILEFGKTYELLGVEELAYVDVEKTVDKAVSLFPNLRDVKVLNACHGLTVLADSLLRQLFYNLVDNSLKYGEKLSCIRVFYEEKEGGHLNVIYEDDGVGISAAAKPKLFDEGYTTGKGSGYGLYLVKKMMEIHSWNITEKGEPGKGAKFIISIPRTNRDGKENYRLH